MWRIYTRTIQGLNFFFRVDFLNGDEQTSRRSDLKLSRRRLGFLQIDQTSWPVASLTQCNKNRDNRPHGTASNSAFVPAPKHDLVEHSLSNRTKRTCDWPQVRICKWPYGTLWTSHRDVSYGVKEFSRIITVLIMIGQTNFPMQKSIWYPIGQCYGAEFRRGAIRGCRTQWRFRTTLLSCLAGKTWSGSKAFSLLKQWHIHLRAVWTRYHFFLWVLFCENILQGPTFGIFFHAVNASVHLNWIRNRMCSRYSGLCDGRDTSEHQWAL